jgi:hypothetical protein
VYVLATWATTFPSNWNSEIDPGFDKVTIARVTSIEGRLHGASLMCVYVSDKLFDTEACNIGGQASAKNGLKT